MITPIEIRQHSFKKGFRGYDTEEVDAFLSTLSNEWEKVLGDFKNTKQELERTRSDLDSLRKVESALHKTLMQAEQASKSAVENAERDAELKLQEADNKSRSLLSEALKDRARIQMEINNLINQRNEILQQLKVFLNAQTDRLKNFEENEMKKIDPRKETQKPEEGEQPSFFESSMDDEEESQIVDDILEKL